MVRTIRHLKHAKITQTQKIVLHGDIINIFNGSKSILSNWCYLNGKMCFIYWYKNKIKQHILITTFNEATYNDENLI